MWRAAGTQVAGTSHAKLDIPCQDFCAYERAIIGSTSALMIAIADGAGSARLSQVGARSAVEHLLRLIPLQLPSIIEANEDLARQWLDRTRQHLEGIANEQSADVHDFACTILFAVLGEFASFFVQVGDGAWVVQKNGEYFAATWPSGGEYANETTFLTSPNWNTSISFRMVVGGISAVAGFTDGLQRLALQLNSRSVHVPFFKPLFDVLRSSEDETTLISPLIEFLSSERVVERTDDDKTLVLACRQEPLLLTNVD
jgi:hypothetical protein